MTTTVNPIFTIGHSNHPIEWFIELLRENGITAVADVRSKPYCRYARWFDGNQLERSLRTEGIRYVFMGEELGARPRDPACYENGRVRYDRIARTESFRRGIDRLVHGARTHRIACMCVEEDPLDCHRTLVVARELDARGIEVHHIRGNGKIEAHVDAMDRLLCLSGLAHEDFFRTRADRLAEAIKKQEERIAYEPQVTSVPRSGKAA